MSLYQISSVLNLMLWNLSQSFRAEGFSTEIVNNFGAIKGLVANKKYGFWYICLL